jgi:hypothetical protein
MAWITQLLKKPEANKEEGHALENATDDDSRPLPPMVDAPQLAVLAPDIGGISSFRLKLFDDVGSAELFIEEMHPEARRSTHAFWALHDEPDVPANDHKEALVLIRANPTASVVYVVSFVDLESAWSFARFETKRGLDPSHLLIYWAAFAGVREEFNSVSIVPSTPPATVSRSATTIEREATRTADFYPETRAPEDNLIGTPAQSEREARAAEEAARRASEAEEAAAQAQKLAELTRQAEAEAAERADAARRAEEERIAREEREKAILEAAKKAEEERLLAESEAIRNAEAERIAIQEEATRQAELARIEAEAEAARRAEAERLAAEAEAARRAEEARLQAEAQAKLETDESRLAFEETPEVIVEAEPAVIAEAEPTVTDEAVVLTPPEPVTSYPGDEETTDDADHEDADQPAATGVVFTHAPTEIEDTSAVEVPQHFRKKKRNKKKEAIKDPAEELPDEPSLSDFDIAWEVERLLKNRRWEKREEPFGGFRSPPGRF